MNKQIIFPAICLSFLIAACNSSSSDKDKKADTTSTTVDTTHHMAPTTSIPDLPPIPDGAKVFFANLKNGATVHSPLKIQMGTTNIRVDTVGPVLNGSGHHHLLIDAEDSLSAGTVVPKDSTHIHFGKGQTETEVTLSPGKHKLTLQFADGAHRSYGGRLATTIEVTVK